MQTATICRAENGRESCRYHKTGATQISYVNPKETLRVMANAESDFVEAQTNADLDTAWEANLVREEAQLTYDSSLTGIADLENRIRKAGNTEERLLLKNRLEQAKANRSKILSEDPVYQTSQVKKAQIIEQLGTTSSIDFSATNFAKLDKRGLKELNARIPEGATVLVESDEGWSVDVANNSKQGKSWIDRKLADFNFVDSFPDEPDATVALKSSKYSTRAKGIKKVTVLNSTPEYVIATFGKKEQAFSNKIPTSSGRYAIKGDNYYAEVEGRIRVSSFSPSEKRSELLSNEENDSVRYLHFDNLKVAQL